MANRVVHFEIPAKNTKNLEKFYRNVFHWKFNRWDGPMSYWMIETGNKKVQGIDGGMAKKGGNVRQVVNTIDVKNIDLAIKDIKKSGGKMATEKMPVPGIGWMAYFKDPEGNKFGVMQEDMSAK